jgi:hypothetical protein
MALTWTSPHLSGSQWRRHNFDDSVRADPDDLPVLAGIDSVRWELSLLFGQDG